MSSPLGMAHFTAGLVALALGAVIVCERKGTPTHRMIGVGYVSAMLIVNVTALCLYRLTGRFGPFHALAPVSLAIVIGGIVANLLHRERWLHTHYYCTDRTSGQHGYSRSSLAQEGNRGAKLGRVVS